MDMNQILKDLPKEMRAMHIKGERAKRELAELENKEKYAVRKLMEATLQKKKENEAMLKAAQESLDCLIQKLNERKAKSEILMKKINQKRSNSLMVDMQDREAAQNHAEITKRMMEKIQEQTEIVEKQTIILKRSHGSKESSKYYRSKINNLKAEIADKQNELDYVLNVYTGLGKACQEMHQKNVKKSSECKEMDENATAMQSSVDTLNGDIKKLTSE
ncbi:uncharacterized protein LOC132926762 [Rhopalosiphum padi]|uniref:uncharacterized protein LOC132926762 n=1 Tax=Rhopalosiphum padi TaxID=40932 RepID=UPI00298E9E17|nr:uncharacterized protein LOC132926762 [Rhopalosiphum padi]